jgi:tetratricopeptide (TPR) repeat protein
MFLVDKDITSLRDTVTKAVRVAEYCDQKHPESVPGRLQLASSYAILGDECCLGSGQFTDALLYLSKGIAACEQGARSLDDPVLQNKARDLRLSTLAIRYLTDRCYAGQYRSSLEEACLQIEQDSALLTPGQGQTGLDYVWIWYRLGVVYSWLARFHLSEGNVESALAIAMQGVTAMEDHAKEFPETNVFQLRFAELLWLRGEALWRMGRHQQAKRDMAAALRRYSDPNHSDFVAMLVTCPFADCQDPMRACGILKVGMEKWHRPDLCICAILAQYRLANYKSALELIEEYRDDFELEDPAFGFLQAACLLRLNRASQAHATYQRAQQIYSKRPPFQIRFDITCHEVMRMFGERNVPAEPVTEST